MILLFIISVVSVIIFSSGQCDRIGVRLYWCSGKQPQIAQLWNPWSKEIPWVTIISHPLLLKRGKNTPDFISSITQYKYIDKSKAKNCCLHVSFSQTKMFSLLILLEASFKLATKVVLDESFFFLIDELQLSFKSSFATFFSVLFLQVFQVTRERVYVEKSEWRTKKIKSESKNKITSRFSAYSSFHLG